MKTVLVCYAVMLSVEGPYWTDEYFSYSWRGTHLCISWTTGIACSETGFTRTRGESWEDNCEEYVV